MTTTASAKAKGRRAQQLVRDSILKSFSNLTEDDVRSTSMGANGLDILLSTAAKEAFPFNVEVKARAKIGLVYDALAQAAQSNGLTSIAVVKADRKEALVVLTLADFLKIVSG